MSHEQYLGPQRRREDGFEHCGRRDPCPMMEDSAIEAIAEKAAEKAIEKLTAHVYQEIGRGLVQKLLYVFGAATVALALWLHQRGFLK